MASQELRNNALCPINVPFPKDITNSQYCVLEAIGRSRHNGETTSGLYSLLHYCKDSQMLFYVKYVIALKFTNQI